MDLSLNKLPWYAQIGVFVVLSLAGVAAFWYLYATPAELDLAARQQQLDTIRADISTGIATARQLQEFKKEVGDLEAKLKDLKAVLPEQKDIADLINTIQNLAVQSNMTIRAVKPQATKTQTMHEEWPIGLELDGTYHNLGLFFDKVASFPRVINVGNVIIRAKEHPEPNSTISAECVATTYVLLAQPKAAPPKPAAPPPATGGF